MVDVILLTAIFSVWIFLFKKIHAGDNLECGCTKQIEAFRRLQRRVENNNVLYL